MVNRARSPGCTTKVTPSRRWWRGLHVASGQISDVRRRAQVPGGLAGGPGRAFPKAVPLAYGRERSCLTALSARQPGPAPVNVALDPLVT